MFTGSIPTVTRGFAYPLAIEISDGDAVLLSESVLNLAAFTFALRDPDCGTAFATTTGEVAAEGVVQCIFSPAQTQACPRGAARLTLDADDEGDAQRLLDLAIYIEG